MKEGVGNIIMKVGVGTKKMKVWYKGTNIMKVVLGTYLMKVGYRN